MNTRLLALILLLLAIVSAGLIQSGDEAQGSIIQRGVSFTVSSDSAGRYPITTLSWGKISLGVKYTRTFYIVNKNSYRLICSIGLTGWSWQTTDPSKDLLINVKFSTTTPTLPGKYTKVTVEQTLLRPLIGTSFSYQIVITGTQLK